jgi:hypothetical protein
MIRSIHAMVAFFTIGMTAICAAEPNDAAVEKRIKELTNQLVIAQKSDGSWSYNRTSVGITALCLQAVLQADMPKNSPVVRKAAKYLVRNTDNSTYGEALVAVALEKLDPVLYKSRIAKAGGFLSSANLPKGNWSYGYARKGLSRGDNSNAQFAVLGLGAVKRAGIPISPKLIKRATYHWTSTQNADGSWGYVGKSRGTFSMTCAGLASLRLLGLDYAKRSRSCTAYSYQQNIKKSLDWITRRLKAKTVFTARDMHRLYSMYALERAALHMNVKTFDGFDWYRWGVGELMAQDTKRLGMHDKAFALLFLSKGSAPIAIAKCKWDGDWNNQIHDVANWCELAGTELKSRFDWLSSELGGLDSPAAKASLVFLTGTQKISLNEEQTDFLRAFLDEGGTVVAEVSCESKAFPESFKKGILKGLYPKLNARWVPISSSHPACTIKHRLQLKDVVGLELRVGCRRVNLLLLYRNLSCTLNGDADLKSDRPRASKLAINLLAWALKTKAAEKKLDTYQLKPPKDISVLTVDAVKRKKAGRTLDFKHPFCRLKHRGNWFASPRYFDVLDKLLKMRERFPKFDGEVFVSPLTDDLFNAPLVFMTGYDNPMISHEAALSLRNYVNNGGAIFITNACTSKDFDKGVRLMATRMFPNDAFAEIPKDDPIYKGPFDLTSKRPVGTKAYVKRFKDKWAPLLGIRRNGRWVMVYSAVDLNSDVSEGLHDSVVGYRRESAAALSVNVISDLLKP